MQRLPFLVILCITAGLLAWNVGRFVPEALSAERRLLGDAVHAPVASAMPSTVVVASAPGADASGAASLDANDPATLLAGEVLPDGGDCPEEEAQPPVEDPMEESQVLHLESADGTLTTEVEVKDGLREGHCVEYLEGEKVAEGDYIEGARAGHWVFWRQGGTKRAEGNYSKGLKDGPWESWHEEGTLERRVEYATGEPHGHYIEWYTNGMVRAEGDFVMGRREGDWYFYDFDGSVDLRTGYYSSGKRVR